MDNFFPFLLSNIYTIPFVLVYLAGIALSLTNREKSPKASRLALVGCSLLLLNSFIHMAFSTWLVFGSRSGNTNSLLATVMTINGALTTLFGVAGFIFLLAAIFAKTDDSPQISNIT